MSVQKAEPGKTRVGWIGTGVMGRWMCQHLINKGYQATVYNRSQEKARPLLEAGASWGETPQKVAERSDVIFAIVGFPADVREVFLGAQGALAGSQPGARQSLESGPIERETHTAGAARHRDQHAVYV